MKTFLQTLFFFLLVTQICFAQWYQQNSGTAKNLYAVYFTDANNGIAVGDSGTILRTTNGGTAWAIQASGTILPLNDIFFTDEYNGWIVGAEGIILHTTDAGTTWLPQTSGITDEIKGVCFIDANTGWAVGNWSIIKTTNGGSTWIDQSNPSIYPLDDVYFINANLGFIVGGGEGGDMYASAGVILKTTNGGDNWSIIADSSIHWLGISFSDSLNGIVVGRECGVFICMGSIFRTTDGGINWLPALSYGFSFCDIEFVELNHIWVVGANDWSTDGTILFSSDRGVNWSEQSVISSLLNSVCFINSSTGWAVGDNGTILYTTNGGVSFVGDETTYLTEFNLSQNYPNPFNPSTKIKYSIPHFSDVVLKIYDILGREVATLVNEEKPAGEYEVEFNASNLLSGISAKGGYASGVYFYELKAGNFVETRKMVLLR